MNAARFRWHDYRYFPYERRLAEREVVRLFKRQPILIEGGLDVANTCSFAELAARLTYFKAAESSQGVVIPDQAKLEASSTQNGQALLPDVPPTLRRQSTRYSAHGLHEYRGKFNPQIVRAIGNLFGLAEGAWVFDPFCGSGTTILEAAHIGWNALGLDANPLGVLIANAKIAAFMSSPTVLSRECDALTDRLHPVKDGSAWRDRLPEPEYLQKWFPEPVLRQLSAILQQIELIRPVPLQDVFRVALSDICRAVSFQDPNDLRIRRRKDAAENYPAVQLFLNSSRAKVASVVRARQCVQPKYGTTQHSIVGDSRNAAAHVRVFLAQRRRKVFDAAITSPPYATAMPYLDTQRLSLALLGLLGSRDLRQGEKRLIGNREIQDRERIKLEAELCANGADLPDAVIGVCRSLLSLANDAEHGFRRRNVPALVYKYLADMGSMFASVRLVLRSKGRYALLVGRNSTKLRGELFLIDTPQLLAEVAESRGWQVEDVLSFDAYHRFDVHQENSIRAEVLVILRRA